MISSQLVEIASDLIINKIKDNISSALNQVNTDRTTLGLQYGVAIPTPREYFIFEKAQNYQCPSIYVICRNIDFQKTRGANHINAIMDFGVSALVEAQREGQETVMAWRYQSAIHKILDQTALTDAIANVKIVCISRMASFSETFSSADTGRQGMFRKEVLLDFNVEHYEPL